MESSKARRLIREQISQLPKGSLARGLLDSYVNRYPITSYTDEIGLFQGMGQVCIKILVRVKETGVVHDALVLALHSVPFLHQHMRDCGKARDFFVAAGEKALEQLEGLAQSLFDDDSKLYITMDKPDDDSRETFPGKNMA